MLQKKRADQSQERRNLFECSSDEVNENLSNMWDDDELDDLEPGPAPFGEFGRDEELWFRCDLCSC
jgi:hypothetical protein